MGAGPRCGSAITDSAPTAASAISTQERRRVAAGASRSVATSIGATASADAVGGQHDAHHAAERAHAEQSAAISGMIM